MSSLLSIVVAASCAVAPQSEETVPVAAAEVLLLSSAGELSRRPLAGFRLESLADVGAVLVRLEGVAQPSAGPAPEELGRVTLVGGDVLRARVTGGEGDVFQAELVGGVGLSFSIEQVVSLVFPGRVPAAWTRPVVAAEEDDRLYRRQGDGLDRLDGTVQELTDEGVRFHGLLGSQLLPWNEVAALFIATFDEPDAGGVEQDLAGRVVLDLAGGGRIRGRLHELSESGCRITIGGGASVVLPLAAVTEVAVADGSIAFLSDREPSQVAEGSPFGDDLGMRWPHRKDRSVTGGLLTAGGRRHNRGLGVHAPSRLTYTLDGSWSELRGSVAIDDEVLLLASRGSVVFRIRVDGEERWTSPLVRGGEAPAPIEGVSLKGARELVLEADEATDAFVADRADWLLMMLVR